MKNLIFVLFFLPLAAFSQTKKETQNWIKQKIEQSPFEDDYNIFNYLVTFIEAKDRTDNEDWIYIRINQKTQESDGFGFMYFPVHKIGSIEFSEKENVVELTFYSKNKEKVFKIANGFSPAKDEKFNKLTIYLSKEFKANNMQSRFKKAFINLIKFSTPKLIKEPY